MKNKICVITGANSGIGKQTAIDLAKKDYQLILICRKSSKSETALAEIKGKSGNNNIRMFYADLSLMKEIRRVAKEVSEKYERIDVLINNAGILKNKREITSEGIEMNMAVNFLAPYLLSRLLLPKLENSGSARIINLNSELHRKGKIDFSNFMLGKGYSSSKAYNNSKLANLIISQKLAEELKGKNVTVNSVHPGVIATDALREMPKWILRIMKLFTSKVEKGAEPSVYLATAKELEGISGKYFNKKKQVKAHKCAYDQELQNEVWKFAKQKVSDL